LNYLRGLAFIKKHIDTGQIETVMEVGGGYGTLGEILLKCEEKDYFYLDVDIPPTGYIAAYYLKQVFGSQAIASYGVTRDWEEIDLTKAKTTHRATVVTPWQLPQVKGQIDLFVNFISFQEMEPDVVTNYIDHVNRLGATYVLLRNSTKGKKSVGRRIVRDDYIRLLSSFHLIASDSFVFGGWSPTAESEVMIFRRK